MRHFIALVVVAAVALVSGGCSTLPVAPNVTAGDAQAETTALTDHVLAGIDESLIARLDDLDSESHVCYPPHADSDQSILAWESRRFVVLTDDAVPLDVLNEILAGFDETKWHIGKVEEYLGEVGSGQVSLSGPGPAGVLRYGIQISASTKGTAPAAINVIATSPCFETK